MKWKKLKIKDGVQEIHADSWRGFVSYIQNELSNYRAYVYRGQREPDWKLIPSRYRIDGIKSVKNNTLETLAAFKMSSRGRRGTAPINLTDDDWWALGQSHGLKTPLLDWSESPFVAAFFAFAKAREPDYLPKDRMVYAIAKQQVAKKTEEIKKTDPGTLLGGTDAIEIMSPLVDDNNRLVSQRGLFTKSLGYRDNIEEWIRTRFKESTSGIMIKINITESADDRNSFLRFLNRMNVNYLSLFPDLDGAARYCNMQLEIDKY
ncbi:MAG: FRG domain-containing protein [Syntrophobacteraceae bacterium]